VSWYQVKPIWILLKQQTVGGSGISWAICKCASRPIQITTPVAHHSVFLQARCLSCCPTNSDKALKATEPHRKLEIHSLSLHKNEKNTNYTQRYNMCTKNDDLNFLVCVNGTEYNEWYLSFYRTMHYSAKHSLAITCRLSVCLSV